MIWTRILGTASGDILREVDGETVLRPVIRIWRASQTYVDAYGFEGLATAEILEHPAKWTAHLRGPYGDLRLDGGGWHWDREIGLRVAKATVEAALSAMIDEHLAIRAAHKLAGPRPWSRVDWLILDFCEEQAPALWRALAPHPQRRIEVQS